MLAAPYLRLFGIAFGGILLNKSKNIVQDNESCSVDFKEQKIEVVDFYNKYILPEIDYIAGMITSSR
jgi:hypothetical protein